MGYRVLFDTTLTLLFKIILIYISIKGDIDRDCKLIEKDWTTIQQLESYLKAKIIGKKMVTMSAQSE